MSFKRQVPLFITLTGILTLWAFSIRHYDRVNSAMSGGGDSWGYYVYLPSALISGDLTTLETAAAKRKEMRPESIAPWLNPLGIGEVYFSPIGHPVIKYTSGVAMMLSPFFLTAHVLAPLVGQAADGYSPVYFWAMYIGLAIWVVLGFLALFQVLTRYVSRPVALLTLLMLGLATNLYHFVVYYAPMAHAPLFALYAFLIYASEAFYRRATWRNGAFIGLLCGMITLIRPTEIIAVLIPLLWHFDGFGRRFRFLKDHWPYLLLAAVVFILPIIPQLIYWKAVSDSWVFYSYGGEGFDFRHPHILLGLFGFANGWLVYTPVFCLIIPGLAYLYFVKRRLFWPIIAFLICHVYIIYSWHNWWYINSFGSRPMIETYALAAIPWAILVQRFYHGFGKWLVLCFVLGTMALNLFQTWQVSQAIMLSEEGSEDYYTAIFGKTEMTERTLIAADSRVKPPAPGELDSLGVVADLRVDTFALLENVVLDTEEGRVIRVMDQQLKLNLTSIDVLPGDYLRIVTRARSEGWNSDRWGMARQVININQDGEWILWVLNRINNKLGNDTWNLWGGQPGIWGEAWFFIRIPHEYRKGDQIQVWIENPAAVPLLVNDFHVEKWRQR
ncbi:MAG: glycosyltransferase family 39 protein [Saprospiraceae bacterium]|nr:glycosyltransferase family 39 protein [Saprospiraceae bacterium]